MQLAHVLSGAALALALAAPVTAQDYPSRPIDMVVAYGAGGGTDALARMLSEYLSAELGQPIVVLNKPGAGGTIGAEFAANADPDGYTLYMMATGHTIAAAMYQSLAYDAVSDFAGITKVAEIPYIFVTRPDFEAQTLDQLIGLAKDKPGDVTFASVGVGSTQHFVAELLEQTAGIDMLHIPYQQTPEALAALLSGEVDLLVENFSPMVGQVQQGQVTGIAVTSAQPHPTLPDVPTVASSGLDYQVNGWYGVSAPAGTPAEIVDKINAAFTAVLAKDEVKARLLEQGYVAAPTTAADFDAFLAEEVDRWNSARESAGIEQR